MYKFLVLNRYKKILSKFDNSYNNTNRRTKRLMSKNMQ